MTHSKIAAISTSNHKSSLLEMNSIRLECQMVPDGATTQPINKFKIFWSRFQIARRAFPPTTSTPVRSQTGAQSKTWSNVSLFSAVASDTALACALSFFLCFTVIYAGLCSFLPKPSLFIFIPWRNAKYPIFFSLAEILQQVLASAGCTSPRPDSQPCRL